MINQKLSSKVRKSNIINIIAFNLVIFLMWMLLILSHINEESKVFYYPTGLILTYFLAKYMGKDLQCKWYLKLILPFLYLIMSIIAKIYDSGISISLLFNPILYAFIFLLSGLFIRPTEKNAINRNITLVFIFALMISSTHKYERKFTHPFSKQQYDFSIINEAPEVEEPGIALEDLSFFNEKQDTISLINSGKYILLETWHERCPPCFLAMKDLEPFYLENQQNFDQYYIYVKPHKKNDINYDKLFNADLVSDKKDRHLVDYDELLYSKGIQSTPQFLLFDPSGKLIFKHVGYGEKMKEKLESDILSHIKTK
jgi:thioredoxin-related protein